MVGTPRGSVPDVIVVAGARTTQSAWLCRRTGPTIEHVGWQQGQLSSLLGAEIGDPLLEAAVVTLVGVPAGATVSGRGDRGMAACPAHRRPPRRRCGHPVVSRSSVFADLRAADISTPARKRYSRNIRTDWSMSEVKDPGAFEDIDTPGDYEGLHS